MTIVMVIILRIESSLGAGLSADRGYKNLTDSTVTNNG